MIATIIALLLHLNITPGGLGDLDGDGRQEETDVISLLKTDLAETEYYYYFNNKHIPLLPTTGCASKERIHNIGDIDEDGTKEIVVYASSCTSRYKSIVAYTLKEQSWQEIGRVMFDTFAVKPKIEKRIQKTGKGEFIMREITKEADGSVSDKAHRFEME